MAVQRWHDWVVAACQDQGRLLERPKPGQARPPHHCEELVKITNAGRARHGVGMLSNEVWVIPMNAAVNLRRYLAHEALVEISARRRQVPEHPWVARDHDRTWGRCRQH